MAKKRSVRRMFSRTKHYSRRHKTMSGVVGTLVTGAVAGGVLAFARPTINSVVPKLGPINPTTSVLLGSGAALKLMHKGGVASTVLLGTGALFAAHDLISSTGMASTSTAAGSPSVYG